MKKIKEKWSKFTKSQKVLAIIVGALIVCIIMASCSNPSSTTDSSSNDRSNTKQEQQKEEPATEDKSEPEEDPEPEPELGDAGDEYVPPKEAANDKKYSIEDVDKLALTIFEENFDSSSNDVSVKTVNKTVYVTIIGYDLDVSQLTKSQINYLLQESDIPSSFGGLADSMEEFYNKAGFDVNVVIELYDTNTILVYTARS